MEKTLRLAPWMLLIGLCAQAGIAAAAGSQPVPVVLGHSVVPLNGPWKFHVGDDPHWADPGFDDSGWENVDLTPQAGAHDDDVGLSGYVPGWSARGHGDYSGYAWYRMQLGVTLPAGESLALVGPFAVESTYQIFINGQLLGGVGDFSGESPAAYSNHRPRLFSLPPDLAGRGTMVLAVRVWMGPEAGGPEAGGIHIAPLIGDSEAAAGQYRLQWLQIFEGYVVDAAEGLIFLLLAAATLCLMPFDRSNRAYPWLAAALLLSAIARGNQAVFFWGQFESIHDFELFIAVLAYPLSMGAWMQTWRAWFRVESPLWLSKALVGLTLLYMLAVFLGRTWFHGVFPHEMGKVLYYLISCVRLLFLMVFALIVYQGVRHERREAWYALPAMLAIGVGLFAQELSKLRVPGIWFPFGVGVSRTEYAYMIFYLALSALLLCRLWSYAGHLRITTPESRA